MGMKQKIPDNARECDIYKQARNFLMDVIVSPVWIFADAHSTISSAFYKINDTFGYASDALASRYFYCFGGYSRSHF